MPTDPGGECVSQDDLQRLADKSLSDQDMVRVTSHLESCESCTQRYERLTDSGLIDLIRNAHAPQDSLSEAELAEYAAFRAGLENPPPQVVSTKELEVALAEHEYTNLERVGSGGYGAVYSATYKREFRVAIKVVTTDTDIDDLKGAKVDHPNVVKFRDFGELPELQRRYVVMDFIDGQSFDEVLAGQNGRSVLDLRPQIEVIQQVALALESVHRAGLAHLDVKPANLLIEEKDGSTRPVLVDFGLARDMTEVGDLWQVGGTLQFMSPEQLRGEAEQESDIYSLGVVLYQTITGQLPFRGDASALVKQIERTVPQSPRELNRHVSVDLASICQKCLEKSPKDRYESAAALAEDLQSYMEGRPTQAQPVGALGRLVRWRRRNKRLAAAFAVAACLLCMVLIGSIGWSIRERHQRKEIERNWTTARVAVEQYFKDITEDERLKSIGMEPLRRQLLTEGISFYERLVLQAPADPDLYLARAEAYWLLADITAEVESYQKAAKYYSAAIEILKPRIQDDGEAHLALAGIWGNRGGVLFEMDQSVQAKSAYNKAIRLYSDHYKKYGDPRALILRARARGNLAMLHSSLVDHAAADADYQRVLKTFELLVEEFPENSAFARDLARAESLLGDHYDKTGRTAEARAMEERALMRRQQLVARHVDDADLLHDLAISLGGQGANRHRDGQLSDAIDSFEQALKILNDLLAEHPDVLDYRAAAAERHHQLAAAQLAMGDLPAAAFHQNEAVAGRESLWRQHPYQARYQSDLMASLNNQAAILHKLGKIEEAAQSLDRQIKVAEILARKYPHLPRYGQQLANAHYSAGIQWSAQHEYSAALTELKKGRERCEQLKEQFPAYRDIDFLLADCLGALADAHKDEGRYNESRRLRVEAIGLLQRMPEQDDRAWQSRLASGYLNLGLCCYLDRELDEAEGEYKKALPLLSKLAEEHTDVPEYQSDRALVLEKLAAVELRRRKLTDALGLYEEALSIRRRVNAEFPDTLHHMDSLADSLNNVGTTCIELKRIADGEPVIREMIELRKNLVDRFPQRVDLAESLTTALSNLAALKSGQGQLREAQELFVEIVATRQELAERFPESVRYQEKLASANLNLGLVASQQGEYDAAAAALHRALDIYQRIVATKDNLANRAEVLMQLGMIRREQRDFAKALHYFSESETILMELTRDASDVLGYHQALAKVYSERGLSYLSQTALAEAASEFERALELRQGLAAELPDDIDAKLELAGSLNKLSACLLQTQQEIDRARLLIQQQIALLESLGDRLETKVELGNGYNNLATIDLQAGNVDEAIRLMNKGLEVRMQLAEAKPEVPLYRESVADSWFNLAVILKQAERYEEALTACQKAIALRADIKPSTDVLFALSKAQLLTGDTLVSLSRVEEGARYYEVALNAVSEAMSLDETYALLPAAHTQIAAKYAAILERRGQFTEASEQWQRAIQTCQDQQRLPLELNRIRALAHTQKHAEAIDTITKLTVNENGKHPVILYNAACIYAIAYRTVAADETPDDGQPETASPLLESLLDRTMDALREAAAAGFFSNPDNLDHFLEDTDFSAVRGTDAMKELTKTLTGGDNAAKAE